MQPFIHDDFLLTTPIAAQLYHEYAAGEPVFDYHCHLSPQDLAENRSFSNLSEAWLEGDHYKWRAMRLHGTEEKFCTGNADPFEKFQAFAATIPHTLRNPIYHWTHLELARYFGLLSHFVGMLTDSRSMMSYPRHEYFRRILGQMLGNDIVNGSLPNDIELVGSMVKNISFTNAQNFFE